MPGRNSITSNFEQRNPSSTFMLPTTCAHCTRPLSISISLPHRHRALSTHSPEQSRFPLLHNFVFEIGFLFISFCVFARLALDVCKSITMLMSSATLTCITMAQHGTVCLVSFTTRRMTDVIGFGGVKRSIELIYCSVQKVLQTPCCDSVLSRSLLQTTNFIKVSILFKYSRA
jgi:hypothetical protein